MSRVISSSRGLAVTIEGVHKRFGAVQAVRDISLEIREGSLCGFLGPNGAGKSTTIRMIMSIISPDTGRVEVLGSSALAMKDRIGYLPEERGLYRKMKVGEFLAYLARLKGVHASGLTRRIEDWLERLALPGVTKRRCEELSKGQQQKIQLLASIIHAPDLLILDEPFSGLDPINGRLVTELIRSEQARGATIIFSTHQMHTAEALCDRVVLINKGEKVLDEDLTTLRARHDDRGLVCEPKTTASLGAEQFADLAIARGIASRAQVNDEGVVDLELAHGTDPESAMRAVLEISPMRSMALRRMNLDDLFVELVGASDARLNDIQTPSAHSRVNHSSAHSSVHRTKGARVDA
ncbi:MAG: ATP-binding cassette domain-containing protein [Planctomycetota bacterium]|jgi:ABC-2 type transport system ATP-binding protein|nr:MAG: ATP-binding cassette domain-containing protein [Planctomycetota bacterium]RLS94744.1 MAG: ATP-binding cassette domain-containing protein [Planctomycetota bacterium]